MKKVKLLVSVCIVAVLSIAIVYEVSKIENENKAEIVKSINEQKTLVENTERQKEIDKQEDVIKQEEFIENGEKTRVDTIEDAKGVVEATINIEDEIIKSRDIENKEIVKNIEYNKTEEVPNEERKSPSRGGNPSPNVDKPSYSEVDRYIYEIEQAILISVNLERSKTGLEPLTYNNTMQNYARIKSKDMGDRDYFNHKNPEGELITAQMKKDGVSYNAWGENIAYIQGDSSNASLAEQFMTNWMNSQGHRENILSEKFTSIGVGVYKVGNKYYATQEFYR